MDQWLNVADAYFVPSAAPLIIEQLFRRYLGGEPNQAAISAARAGVAPALDTVDRALATTPYLAGDGFSLADIHWMPYLEYLHRVGDGGLITSRRNLLGWWNRVSERATWQAVARTGPQPEEPGMTAEAIERLYR
jgi:glutathione S-transferase